MGGRPRQEQGGPGRVLLGQLLASIRPLKLIFEKK
jgi:hypothetical protein